MSNYCSGCGEPACFCPERAKEPSVQWSGMIPTQGASWMDRETAYADREWRTRPTRHFPMSKPSWEVSCNGEAIGVRATLTSADSIQELIAGLQAYVTFFEERESASAIEARRAETQSGSVEDESAVAKPDAQGRAA